MTGVWLLQANALYSPLADESIHCCVCSPPYWNLRDYGTGQWIGGDAGCDHTKKRSLESLSRSTLKNDGRENFGILEGHKRLEVGEPYRDTCGKCGARRIDNQLGLESIPDCGAWSRGKHEPYIAWEIDDDTGERTPYIAYRRTEEIRLCGECYVCNMVRVFREVRRVLRPDGVVFLNLGDSYAGSGGAHTHDHANPGLSRSAERDGVAHYQRDGGRGQPKLGEGLKPKDLVGIPWMVAFALRADGWYLRSDIIWSKPNPMPESVTDRPTKSHEYVFLLTKSAQYFYDADAIREPNAECSMERFLSGAPMNRTAKPQDYGVKEFTGNMAGAGKYTLNPAGRNRRSVWQIATAPYAGAHFATYPPALVEPCIKAGTSEAGCCSVCGKPWERVTNETRIDKPKKSGGVKPYADMLGLSVSSGIRTNTMPVKVTTGFRPACTHDAPAVPCTVLDPFNGSGTTGVVAQQLGRNYVGLDLSAEYLRLARERTGLKAMDEWTNGRQVEAAIDDLPLFGGAL
jgi:DNA modification methylase